MNKRRKLLKVLLLFLLIIVIVIILLNWKGLFINKGRKQKELVSKEELIEWYGLTEEELEGIDLDKIMDKFTWRQSDLEDIDSKEMALDILIFEQGYIDEEDALQKHLEEVGLEYLVTTDEYEGELPDFNEIKYFTVSSKFELYTQSFLIDFNKSVLYSIDSPMPIYIDYTVADTVCHFPEKNKEVFFNALKETNIEKWKHRYGSKRKDTQWEVGIEFNDGTVVSYSGTAEKRGRPKEFEDIYMAVIGVGNEGVLDINTLNQIKYEHYKNIDAKNYIYDSDVYFLIDLYEMKFSIGKSEKNIDKSGNLTGKEKEDIIQLMSNGKVHEWGSFDISADEFEWCLELTYKDNYKEYYGKNLGDTNNPQNYDELINSIIDILNNHQE